MFDAGSGVWDYRIEALHYGGFLFWGIWKVLTEEVVVGWR